jgi:hypothetical protein
MNRANRRIFLWLLIGALLGVPLSGSAMAGSSDGVDTGSNSDGDACGN